MSLHRAFCLYLYQGHTPIQSWTGNLEHRASSYWKDTVPRDRYCCVVFDSFFLGTDPPFRGALVHLQYREWTKSSRILWYKNGFYGQFKQKMPRWFFWVKPSPAPIPLRCIVVAQDFNSILMTAPQSNGNFSCCAFMYINCLILCMKCALQVNLHWQTLTDFSWRRECWHSFVMAVEFKCEKSLLKINNKNTKTHSFKQPFY